MSWELLEQSRANGKALRALHDTLEAICHRLHLIDEGMKEMSASQSALTGKISELQASVNALATAEAQVVSYIQGVPGLIAAAVAEAVAAGASQDQLSALDTLSQAITADAAALAAALPAPSLSPSPSPSVSGGASTIGGGASAVGGGALASAPAQAGEVTG